MLLMSSIWGKGTFILCRKSCPYRHTAKKWAYTDTCPKSSVSAIQHLTVYEQNTKISQQSTISPRAKHQSWLSTILTNPLETLFTLLNQCRRRKKFPPEASRELAFCRGWAHCKTICIFPDGEASTVWPWKVTQEMIELRSWKALALDTER